MDKTKIGRLQSVQYEHGGKTYTVEWKVLGKCLVSGQICLITPSGVLLPVIRKGQL
jgi:acetylglutamate kinase